MDPGAGKVSLQCGSSPIFGTIQKVGKDSSKSVITITADTNPLCPKCKSKKIWRDGHYTLMFGEPIQRWRCGDCQNRFSDFEDLAKAKKVFQEVERIESNRLKSASNLINKCQICDEETSRFSVNPTRETKNLVTELQTDAVPQKHELKQLIIPQKENIDIQDLRGAIVNFIFKLQENEKAPTTILSYDYNLNFLIEKGANLFDPFSVKELLVYRLTDKTKTRKYNLVKAYRAFASAYKINIINADIPKYKPERKDPYIPPESHLDEIIAYCHGQMGVLLLVLKETAARPVEVMRILWDEIDLVQGKIRIDHPAKGCNPRTISITQRLSDALRTLPQTQKKLFTYKNEYVAEKTFRQMRKKAVIDKGNKALGKIHCYTFRYWRATFEMAQTGREIDVMTLLGHTSCKYIYKYVQLAKIYFGSTPKFKSTWVNDREEETKLIDDGYQFIRMDPKDGACLYRKLISSGATLGHD